LNREDGGSKKRPIFIIERAVQEDLPGIGDPTYRARRVSIQASAPEGLESLKKLAAPSGGLYVRHVDGHADN
jgi:hypothetical protein